MENKNSKEPEIIKGFNFEKHGRGKGGQPRQGGLIFLIIQGVFLISIASYLIAEMPSHNVAGADRVQAVIIIALILTAGVALTIWSSIKLAHGRFRGGSHENT